MVELPPGKWPRIPLGMVAWIQSGFSPRLAEQPERDSLSHWSAIGASGDMAVFGDVRDMPLSDAEADRFALVEGDLLVARRAGGEGLDSVAVWRGQLSAEVYLDSLMRIRPGPELDPDYLRYLWASPIAAAQLHCATKGTRRGRALLRRDVQGLEIPLPPLPEQRRIARVLGASIDRLDAASDLVTANREKAERLVVRIVVNAVPAPASNGWGMRTVAEVGEVSLGRQHRPEWREGPNTRPYLRVGDVFEDRIATTELARMHFPDGVFERFSLVPGDILLNEGQSLKHLGRPAMYRGEPNQVAFTNSLLRFRAGEQVDPEWALLVFRHHLHSGRFAREARMTTNLAHLSLSRFAAIEFPLPELSEQKRIADEVRRELTAIGRLVSVLDKASLEARSLRQSLLRDAFPVNPEAGPTPDRPVRSDRSTAARPRLGPPSHPSGQPIWIQQELPL